jgi:DNA replication protein DnaC
MTKSRLNRIKESLHILKLKTIAGVLDDELARAAQEETSTTELLERLFTLEADGLIQRRIERRIKQSKMPERKLLADFDFSFQKGLDKTRIMELADLDFVRRKQGLILAGNSGTGKSHIAKALLLIGCGQTYNCHYTTAADMLGELLASLADDTMDKKLKRYLSPDILLIDEVGFDRIEQQNAYNANLFHKVIDGRYCKKTTIITTNIDFEELGDYLGDPIITTALVDRMVHHSIIINIEGPSWRLHESQQLNAELV